MAERNRKENIDYQIVPKRTPGKAEGMDKNEKLGDSKYEPGTTPTKAEGDESIIDESLKFHEKKS